MRSKKERIGTCLFLLYVPRLALCHFSGLVCDLLVGRLKSYSAESTLPEGHLESQFERALLGGLEYYLP